MKDTMRPDKNSDYIKIPLTIDYKAGRSDDKKHTLFLALALFFVGIVVFLGILFSKNGNIFSNILLSSLELFTVITVIRFFIFKEHKIRNNMISRIDNQYSVNTRKIWGIYSVEDEPPYYVHFRNGSEGLFVLLEKGVMIGKSSDAEYDHYEDVGEAYRKLGSDKISMFHIDYMDYIGVDDRIQGMLEESSKGENKEVKKVVNDILLNLRKNMLSISTTYDVYVFTYKGNRQTALKSIQDALRSFLNANYVSYHFLSKYEHRELIKILFSINDFSVEKACSEASTMGINVNLKPIEVRRNGLVDYLDGRENDEELDIFDTNDNELDIF